MIRTNWQMWAGILSDQQCDQIIQVSERFPVEEATIFSGESATIEDVRRSKVRWPDDPEIGNLLWKYTELANEAFDVDVEPYTSIQYTEYHGADGGKYDEHHDVNWENGDGRDRKLSIVIQLSDHQDYEGGYFHFTECESPLISDFMQRGSILVFPSYLRHSVSPVTSGLRRSLVAWFEGPKWR